MSVPQVNASFRINPKPSSPSFGYQHLSPLLKSLKFFSGSYVPDLRLHRRTVQLWQQKLSLIILHIVAFRQTLRLGFRLGNTDAWLAFQELLYSFVAIGVSMFLVNRQPLLHRCLHQSVSCCDQDQQHLEKV